MRKILVDADACPVVDIVLKLARKAAVPVMLITDSSHQLQRQGATTITVDKGSDSADFQLVNLVQPGDIVVTQDYGLAAMALAKRAVVLNQNGMVYSEENIDFLLESRHISKKIRMAGGRTKGPSKRTKEQDESFQLVLNNLLKIFPKGQQEK